MEENEYRQTERERLIAKAAAATDTGLESAMDRGGFRSFVNYTDPFGAVVSFRPTRSGMYGGWEMPQS